MITVTKKDLIALSYGTSFAADIIREAKKLMFSQRHTYYRSRKSDRVPREAIEELLGIKFPDEQTDCTSCISMQGENNMAKNQRTYDSEYKAQAVKLAQEIGGHKEADEWGIPKGTMYTRIKAFKEGRLSANEAVHTPKNALSLMMNSLNSVSVL